MFPHSAIAFATLRTSHNKKSTTAWPAFKRNSGSCWTRTELPATSGTCGIEKDCSAPSGLGFDGGFADPGQMFVGRGETWRYSEPQRAVYLAPKGRNNEAQANGLGLDYPPILSPALKGRDTCFPIPQSLSQLYVHHTTRNPPPHGQRNSGTCWTRTELPATSGTCGIEEDCSAPSGLRYRFGSR